MTELHEKTVAHLLLADENYAVARSLFLIEPPANRWVATIAFYSAVHYLAAYFWETHQIEINSHRHRARLVRSHIETEIVREHYERLYLTSLDARYEPRALITSGLAREVLESDLDRIQRHINWLVND